MGMTDDSDNEILGFGEDQEYQVSSESNQIPPDLTDDKHCPFCQLEFKHPGSLGRHLDRKKGDSLHPWNTIEQIRSSTKRRKKGSSEDDVLKQVRQKLRGSENSRKYNSKQDIKEKNKVRRKNRDRQIKAKLIAYNDFVKRFGKSDINLDSNFANHVCMFLSVNEWPHDPPDNSTYTTLMDHLQDNDFMIPDLKDKVTQSFERWSKISNEMRQSVWRQERRQSLSKALGNMTLYELQNCETYLNLQQSKIIEDLESHDYKSMVNIDPSLYDDPTNESDEQLNE